MIEIERKFLVRSTNWGEVKDMLKLEQGYLFISRERNMRVRRTGDAYEMTLKVQGQGLARHEINTPIAPEKGQKILDELCVEPPIQKTRHIIEFAGKIWEIDVFEGANKGLILAEVELDAEDENVTLPAWLGPEVTEDDRFFNSAPSRNPFRSWGMEYEELVRELENGR